MAKLTAKQRAKMPKSEFGMPGSRKYPMPDKAHAMNAKARASMMRNKGMMSAAEEARIDAKANKVLGTGRAKAKPAKRTAAKRK